MKTKIEHDFYEGLHNYTTLESYREDEAECKTTKDKIWLFEHSKFEGWEPNQTETKIDFVFGEYYKTTVLYTDHPLGGKIISSEKVNNPYV